MFWGLFDLDDYVTFFVLMFYALDLDWVDVLRCVMRVVFEYAVLWAFNFWVLGWYSGMFGLVRFRSG